MERFNIIAFTHNQFRLEELGKLYLDDEQMLPKLKELKEALSLAELMCISTCNRVEFMMVRFSHEDSMDIGRFVQTLNPDLGEDEVQHFATKSKFWTGINAVNHMIEVASSLDSMVLGEREIITQVRNSYDFAVKNDLAGDMLRIVMKQTIETAKRIYSETDIARNPVSVVSLAYHQLIETAPSKDSKIVVVGAGATNVNMCRFLQDYGCTDFIIYNRNEDNARALSDLVGGEHRPLTSLKDHQEGFDILVACTGASEPIITTDIYKQLIGSDLSAKVVIDLAVPADVDPEVVAHNSIRYISVEMLKNISDRNLEERRKELIKVRQMIYEALEDFKAQFKFRQIEIQMREIPVQVKEIRSRAVNEVFSKEIDGLDPEARETLEKVLNYMEKKYVSVPMLVAKKLVDNNTIN